MSAKRSRAEIEKELAEAEAELEDQRKSMPYHSVRPNQLQRLEELEDRVADLKTELKDAG